MAVEFDTVLKFDEFGATFDEDVDCGTEDDRVLWVWVVTTGGILDTITYDGEALTPVANTLVDGVGNDACQWYELINPPAGTNVLSIRLAGGGGWYAVFAVPAFNGHQTAPSSNGNGASGSGSPVTVNITSASTKRVLNAFMIRHTGGGSDITQGEFQVVLEQFDGSADGGAKSAGCSYEPGDTTTVSSWTSTNAGDWVTSGFSLNEPAAGVEEDLGGSAVTTATGTVSPGISVPL